MQLYTQFNWLKFERYGSMVCLDPYTRGARYGTVQCVIWNGVIASSVGYGFGLNLNGTKRYISVWFKFVME